MMPDREELLDWLRSKAWLLLGSALLAFFGIQAWLERPLDPPPGILAPEDPVQEPPGSDEPWTYRDHRLVPLATFDLHARVLAKERYRWDRAADLSPVDLVMGWGRMSDSAVLDEIQIRQSGRWYYWSTSRFPIPAGEITSHSANMHMIPSSPEVRRQLLALRVGHVVHLQGRLVQAEGPDSWKWTSSLTRKDGGDGACEVVWVESVEAQ